MEITRTELKSIVGTMDIYICRNETAECLIVHKAWENDAPLIRVHSECLFGESFQSLHCDCKWQLEAALRAITKTGGLFVYLFQEGRGVGLWDKVRAMEIQRTQALDTAQAFRVLGHVVDERHYDLAIEVLNAFKVGKVIRLVTNNPNKIRAMESAGFDVVRVELSMQLPQEAVRAVEETQRALEHIPAIFDETGMRRTSDGNE